MNKTVENIVNIVGVALVLGLLLRYGDESTKLIQVTGQQLSSLYSTVSLQNGQHG